MLELVFCRTQGCGFWGPVSLSWAVVISPYAAVSKGSCVLFASIVRCSSLLTMAIFPSANSINDAVLLNKLA